MNRRSFLSSLLAAATLDPERLLWIPGERTIFVPREPIQIWLFSTSRVHARAASGMMALPGRMIS
jgi:hypothetical protein